MKLVSPTNNIVYVIEYKFMCIYIYIHIYIMNNTGVWGMPSFNASQMDIEL